MINVDFADVKSIMSVRGMAMMGIGIASGDNRAADAATAAISSPLLEDIDISGAKGVLVNICGSASMTMEEYEIVSRIIHEKVHEDANIIIGLLVDEELGDTLKVTAIATGFGDRFDMEKGRSEKTVTRLQDVPRSLETPTYIRRAEQPEARRAPVTKAPGFLVEEDDQYDIPTFLRKSVD
jgi:cell division protein FtsZ